jgi:hypothetical protein
LAQFQQQSGIDQLENERKTLLGQLNDLKGRRDRLQDLIKNHDQEEDRRAQKDKNYRKQTDYADRNDLGQVGVEGGDQPKRFGKGGSKVLHGCAGLGCVELQHSAHVRLPGQSAKIVRIGAVRCLTQCRAKVKS